MKGLPAVRKLDEFLQQLLRPTERIVDKELSRFTSPGENYVSVILRIVIKIEDTKTGNERTIDSVAKLVTDSELAEGLFEVDQTVGAEFHYYHSIVPAFDKFLKSQGFPEGADFAVQFYCGRLGLTEPEKADKEAIILLKNLKNDGYHVGASKFEGLDVASAKVVLDCVAKFHATGIGFRHYYSDSFEKKLKPYIFTFKPVFLADKVFITLIHTLQVSNEFNKEEIEIIKALYNRGYKNLDKIVINDVWRTMTHADIWTNNVLIKYVKCKPVHAKLLDFQFYDYGTPSNDVIFFLFSSIKQSTLEDQLDNLLDHYYDTLLKHLKKMDVTVEKFSKESFDEEIKLAVKNKEYFHALWMFQPLMEKSFNEVGALKEQDPNKFLEWNEEHVYKYIFYSVTNSEFTDGLMENLVEDGPFIIQDLPNLITPHMPCDQSKIVKVNYSRARYLDHYGSVYLRLKIELVNTTTGENWALSTIAKTLPKYSTTQDIFKIRAIFKNQVGLYTTARNTIDVYLKGKGVKQGEDVMLRSFGGRINLNGSDDIDQNAVLITTDPKCSFAGFKPVHRRTGFDLESTKAILLALAKFHAGTLTLKTNKFKEFRTKIRPYLNECGSLLESNNLEHIARIHMINALKDSGFTKMEVDKAVKSFDNKVSIDEADQWATFTHSNLWVKNILVKYDKKGQPLDIKLKGFQEAQYASALRDLLFFLFTSVQLVVLKQHLQELISFYYDQFHKVLTKLEVSCDHFLRDSFDEELRRITSGGEFYKIVCALYSVLGNDIHSDESTLKDPLHITRLCFIVKEFIARDWL